MYLRWPSVILQSSLTVHSRKSESWQFRTFQEIYSHEGPSQHKAQCISKFVPVNRWILKVWRGFCRLSKIIDNNTPNARLVFPHQTPCSRFDLRLSYKHESRVHPLNATVAVQLQREPVSSAFATKQDLRVQREIRVFYVTDRNKSGVNYTHSPHLMENESPLWRDLRGQLYPKILYK